jgi:hypothetical protein
MHRIALVHQDKVDSANSSLFLMSSSSLTALSCISLHSSNAFDSRLEAFVASPASSSAYVYIIIIIIIIIKHKEYKRSYMSTMKCMLVFRCC